MLKDKKKVFIFSFFFFSLIVSYILGENSTGGAKSDYLATKKFLDIFSLNYVAGFNLFIDEGQAHFPFFYFLIANANELLGKIFVDYAYIFISSLIPLIFYEILKNKFSNADNGRLFILSLIIFLSPNFRSSAVWVTTDNLALLFFILSVYNFLIFENLKNNYLRYLFYTFFFLILASYIRHYYAIFFIFYFFYAQNKLNLIKNFIILLFNLVLSIPALIYVFLWITKISKKEFQAFDFFSIDLIFNLLVFSSLYLFYFLVFIFNKNFFLKFNNEIKKKKEIIILVLFLFTLLFLFYQIPLMEFGGGIFYKISEFINLKLFFIFSLLGLLSLIFFNNLIFRNYLIFTILIFAFPFEIIYQKYYDPLIIIVFLSLVSSDYLKNLIENKKFNAQIIFVYFLTFLFFSNFYYN